MTSNPNEYNSVHCSSNFNDKNLEVATGERCYSKLNLIKNYLRSTMSQERLIGLANLSIEQRNCHMTTLLQSLQT